MVSQGLFVLFAPLVIHVHPTFAICAIWPPCVRAAVAGFSPRAQLNEWVVKNGIPPDFV